jgi:BirA family biotin operon repressor/biotin-[acetyl-CoA-carboxylase] ligase
VGRRAARGRAPARQGRAAGLSDPDRRERVLAALAGARDDPVSGEELARVLGCSRAAVHRHVEALRRDGLPIEAGRAGYRLAPGADVVSGRLAEARLEPPLAGPVVWLARTGSTNDEAVARARAGAPEGLVVGADLQTAGRGRRGRLWEAAPGDALLVSALLRPPVAPVDAGLLPIVVAVATAEAVGGGATIAWPNDVFLGDRKVAGILCEMSADQESVAWAVAGIGINVRSAPRLEDARWPPGALSDAGPPPARADLLVHLMRALGHWYRRWVDEGPTPILDAYIDRDRLAGRTVTVALEDGELVGRCAGLDALGRLRLVTAEGERRLGAGEVTRIL